MHPSVTKRLALAVIMLMQVLGSTRLRSASSDEEWPYARDMPDEVPFHCYDDCDSYVESTIDRHCFLVAENVRRWYCTWKVTQRLAV